MADSLAAHYIAEAIARFQESKRLAEGAMAQVTDDEFFRTIDEESNSIALVVKHMAGNMRSRWTDFLTSDGEKPDRYRDTEFESYDDDTRERLMRAWEDGWRLVFGAVGSLEEEELLHTVMIRAEPHTVVQAVNRQLTHYAYHAGQIVFLAKHLKSRDWQTLSVARGGSKAFNAGKMGRG